MLVLFPMHPLTPSEVDPDFAAQYAAAKTSGYEVALIDVDAVMDGEATRAVRRLRGREQPTQAIYRGWMLQAEQYRALTVAAAAHGVTMLTPPDAYQSAHELPLAAAALGPGLLPVVVVPAPACYQHDTVLARIQGLGPLIIKDYVKSRADEPDAFAIPDPDDGDAAWSVIRTFLERQGDQLVGGLCFRQRLALRPSHTTGRPREWRVWMLADRILAVHLREPEPTHAPEGPPPDFLDGLRGRVASPFWTVDVAQTTGGGWVVLETGDGQVSAVPSTVPPAEFYAALGRGLRQAA